MNIPNNDGSVCMYICMYYHSPIEAVRAQHAEVVRVLAAAGCDVNAAESEHNQAPINAAVRIGKGIVHKTQRGA